MLTDKNMSLIISFLTLRKLIGILGMLLPFACIVGGSLVQNVRIMDSISAYYHSNMRDILVGVVIGFSVFLMAYRGYEKRDTLIAVASGIAGLGIAIFPCASRACPEAAVGLFELHPPFADYLHYGSSLLFFVLLGVNSFFLFTKGDLQRWSKRKKQRNIVYRVSALLIFASLLTLGILKIILGGDLLETIWTLIFETVMLLAFGVSWLVKGETIFADRPNEEYFDLTKG